MYRIIINIRFSVKLNINCHRNRCLICWHVRNSHYIYICRYICIHYLKDFGFNFVLIWVQMTLVGTVIFSLADKAADDDVTGTISTFRLHPFTDDKVRITNDFHFFFSMLKNVWQETLIIFNFVVLFSRFLQVDGRGKFSMSTLGKEIILKESLDHDAMRVRKQSRYFLNVSVQVRRLFEFYTCFHVMKGLIHLKQKCYGKYTRR